MRKSIATERKKLKKLVAQYGVLSQQMGQSPLIEEEILDGKFPWSALILQVLPKLIPRMCLMCNCSMSKISKILCCKKTTICMVRVGGLKC